MTAVQLAWEVNHFYNTLQEGGLPGALVYTLTQEYAREMIMRHVSSDQDDTSEEETAE